MRGRVRGWIDDFSAWGRGYYLGAIKNTGLSSEDGSPSFSKTFSLLVLASYYTNTNLPPSVAITLIISSHGAKLLLAAIRNGVFGIRVSDKWQREDAETREHAIPSPPAVPVKFGAMSND